MPADLGVVPRQRGLALDSSVLREDGVMPKFLTSDGCILVFDGTSWGDGNIAFQGDKDSGPLNDLGVELDGVVFEEGDKTGIMACDVKLTGCQLQLRKGQAVLLRDATNVPRDRGAYYASPLDQMWEGLGKDVSGEDSILIYERDVHHVKEIDHA